MKYAVTKLEFHSRVARQLNRVMSKYKFQPYNGLIIEWGCGLDISCITHIYKGTLICTGVRFIRYKGKSKPIRYPDVEMNVTFIPERVAVNVIKRLKDILSNLRKKRIIT